MGDIDAVRAEERDVGTPQGASELNGVVMLPLPHGMTRMESGPVQFGDDWPGIFLRGDNAMGIAIVLEGIADMLPNLDPVSAAQLRATAQALTACITRQHNVPAVRHRPKK